MRMRTDRSDDGPRKARKPRKGTDGRPAWSGPPIHFRGGPRSCGQERHPPDGFLNTEHTESTETDRGPTDRTGRSSPSVPVFRVFRVQESEPVFRPVLSCFSWSIIRSVRPHTPSSSPRRARRSLRTSRFSFSEMVVVAEKSSAMRHYSGPSIPRSTGFFILACPCPVEDAAMYRPARGNRAPFGAYLGVLLATAMAVRSGPTLAQESKPAARPAPNSATEPLAPVASMARAAAFLDDVSVNWTRQHQCGTCHTNYPYLAARPSLKSIESPAMAEVRRFFEGRVAHWDDEDKGAGPRWDAEVVATAAALAINDAATTGRLHPLTRTGPRPDLDAPEAGRGLRLAQVRLAALRARRLLRRDRRGARGRVCPRRLRPIPGRAGGPGAAPCLLRGESRRRTSTTRRCCCGPRRASTA